VIRERRSSNFPKGTFKARNLQTRIFSQFLSSALACAGIRRDSRLFSAKRKAPYCCAQFLSPTAKEVELALDERARVPAPTLLRFCRQLSRNRPSPSPSRCGKHLEILCAPSVDRIFAALYVCKVSRTVGFGHAGSPAEKSSPGLNSHRSGGSRFGL